MDLYGVLGVERGVMEGELRQAYRRGAKRCHPDAGGSVGEFARLRTALEVLSDPVRRARYDATGEYEAGVVDNREAELMNLVAAGLDQVVGELVGQGRDPEGDDLVGVLRGLFERRKREHAGQRARLEGDLGRWERLAERFERKGEGANRLRELARGKVEAIRSLMAKCDMEVERSGEALVWLEDYRFARAEGIGRLANPYLAQMAAAGRMW